ncbi:MoxR family ATPase [soil metagenome]
MTVGEINQGAGAIVSAVESVIVGKRDTVRKAVATLLAGGHVLLEDIPGVGKTTMAKALAKSIGGEFRRIQFTPDLLPADVTGSAIFNQKTSEFEFRPGPIFGNVVLVDEINRSTPKTQSALLEAMEERQVTTDGVTRALPKPFFVIATQNAIEMTGTYPLPEAQLDRFFTRLSIGYPDRASEIAVLGARTTEQPLDALQPVTNLEKLTAMQEGVREVFVHERIREYVVDLVRATRESNQLMMGASPRGALHLMRAAQAWAAVEGDDRVLPDHVKAMAPAVLAHRVIGRAELRTQGQTTDDLVKKLVESVKAPTT